MIILVFTLVMIWTTQMALKCSPSAQRPTAKKAGNPRHGDTASPSLDEDDAISDKIQQEID